MKHPAGRGWEAAPDSGGAPCLPAARHTGLTARLPSHAAALDPAQQARPFCEAEYDALYDEAGFRPGEYDTGRDAAQGGMRAPAWPVGWQPGDPPLAYDLEAPDPYARCLPPGADPHTAPFLARGPDGRDQREDLTEGRDAADAVPVRWTTACGLPPAKFDAPTRARLLDHLATTGNVRASAARVGISRETAYRARRRLADFAQLWDAALVEARAHAAGELASYALDGVPQPVLVKGELVATWRRIDARLLLAHMARLDRFAEANPLAVRAAERFDALLAAHLGQQADAVLEEAVEARSMAERAALGTLPPTREEVMRHAAGEAMWAADTDEAEAERACIQAGEAWDRVAQAGHALVDAAFEGAGIGEGEAEGMATGRNRATPVNSAVSPAARAPHSRCRAGSGQARSQRHG